MPFEWKDIITPTATLAAVWLGANFTLRNEIRKKSLEIQSQKLEQLALECELILADLIRYTLAVRNILNDLSSGSEDALTQSRFDEVMRDFKDAGIRIDYDRVIACQNSLEFHRPVEHKLWMATVQPLITLLSKTLSWQSLNENTHSPEKTWQVHEVRAYCHELEEKFQRIKTLRKELVLLLSNDFKKLTQPSSLNLWSLLSAGQKAAKNFFKKPPVTPS